MPAKIFISCGQSTREERQFCSDLNKWFNSEGYDTFVAIDVQSIQDVNSIIITNLRSADYFIFLDFRRERLFGKGHYLKDILRPRYRGSLFTHQELSISYLLGFPESIFLQEQGVQREGLLKFMLGNSKIFANTREALTMITDEVRKRNWRPGFSRALHMVWIPLVGPLLYSDRTTTPPGRFSHIGKIGVKNVRVDSPASTQ